MSDTTDQIDQVWQRIEARLSLLASPTDLHLAVGSSDEALDHVEAELGIRLPEAVRASYRRHDGGFSLEPVIDMDMLSLTEIAEWWRIHERLLHDERWASEPPYYFTDDVVRSGYQTGPVQSVWWHRRWIPLASELAGNLTCIDLAPASGGAVGQIIDWDHECGPTRVLFPDFTHLLAALADQLEHGDDS